jgi:lipopolysaccharide export system protein LptA
MRTRIPSVLVAVCSLCTAELPAQQRPAPAGRCQFEFLPRNPAVRPRVRSLQQPSGQYNSFIGGGFRGFCPAQNITIIADSGEFYGDSRIIFLIGNVDYDEPRVKLTAQRLTYWQNEERVRAERDVDATLPNGTNLKGPVVDYYRPAPAIRPQSRMVAPGRPTVRIVERDSLGRASDPVVVLANTLVMEADSLVYASGKVEMTRPDVIARADSAAIDNGRQSARLMRQPVVEGRGERPFTLHGTVIDIQARNRALERARASGAGRAVSEDATLTADTLDFRIADGKMQHVVAWGPSGARARSPAYDILADSIETRMPGQRIREVHAVRSAYAESAPDTTRLRTTERDRMWGDTIVALFDTVATRDTTQRLQIRSLFAVGSARSFYQMTPQDTAAVVPAANYVHGHEITVAFDSQQVRQVTITGDASGLYLEPGTDARIGVPAGPDPSRPPPAVPPRTEPPRTPPPATRRPPGASR